MPERNLEHERAAYAYDCIQDIKNNHPDVEGKYRSAVLSAGALIQKAGLMQTLAFYLSKKNHYEELADHILCWIQCHNHKGQTKLVFKQLLYLNDEAMIEKNMETMALITWLKRFAEGVLKKEGENSAPVEAMIEEET
ncbi:MAG: hypothetical protein IEMM0008_1631 [bacterium]|nr:MAG: hypothetical protein IEMM0008_1631 [bacterium]